MADKSQPLLKIEKVGKRYGSRTVLKDLSFEVFEGERFFILGPSGCGKTTLLRIIAGLEKKHEGTVRIAGCEVSGSKSFQPPHQRNLGLVFQDGALWPHRTVQKHLTYAPGSHLHNDWHERLLELTGLADRRRDYPGSLSGGERQRLALARALSNRPALLLFDEPLRNLDRNLAVDLRRAIAQILDQTKTTSIFVTHDQEEALSMADRMLLMDREGPVQIGPPQQLFQAPSTSWAAAFFGPVNRFTVRIDAEGKAQTPFGPIDTSLAAGTDCEVLLRASQVEGTLDSDGVRAEVIRSEYQGDRFLVLCQREGIRLHAFCRGFTPQIGAEVCLQRCGEPQVLIPSPGEQKQ